MSTRRLYFFMPVVDNGWACDGFRLSMAQVPSVLKFQLLVHGSVAITFFATMTTKYNIDLEERRWETCRNLNYVIKQLPQRVICTFSRVLFCFTGNILFISQQYPSNSIADDTGIVHSISFLILFLRIAPWFKDQLGGLCPITVETEEIRHRNGKLAVFFASLLRIVLAWHVPSYFSVSRQLNTKWQSIIGIHKQGKILRQIVST